MKNVSWAILLIVLLPMTVLAQPNVEVHLSGGGMNYMGDLVKPLFPYLSTTKSAYGFGFAFLPTPALAFKVHLLQGSIKGSDLNVRNDKDFTERAFSFETNITELGITARWEPFAKKRHPSLGVYKRLISPYIFVGASIAKIDAQPDFSAADRAEWVELIHKDTEKEKPALNFVLPVGAGVRLDLAKRVALDFQFGFRKTFTDYVDGISETANPNATDWYMAGLVNFVIKLGDKDSDKDGIADSEDACPKIAGVISAKGCPDSDNDGVEDLEDLCPYKWGPLRLNGCPDLDQDGVADLADDCPNEKGSIFTNGCPDKDGDHFKDSIDRCPNEAGTKLLQGCPDCDGDGIRDDIDKCPKVAGGFLTQGCPIELLDTDGDGFVDSKDKCPTKVGTVAGCPDEDNDTVADIEDKCPTVFGDKNNEGCPGLSKNEKEVLEMATKEVKFESGSDILLSTSRLILDKIAAILKDYPHYHIDIKGHTDSKGNAEANQKLSELRAGACYNYFIKKGIKTQRMTYEGFGEIKSIASNETMKGRKMNRRVEFILTIK